MQGSNVVQLRELQTKAYQAVVDQRRALIDEVPMSCFSNELLMQIATGAIDFNKIAAVELASRGYDLSGKWVGFTRAHEAALTAMCSASS